MGFSQSEKLSIHDNSQGCLDKLLSKNKHLNEFELDTLVGYIKIGYFLNSENKNAIVISFDSIASLSIYELRENNWIKIFTQRNVGFVRDNDIKAYIEDFNFDGLKDVGIKNEVSIGTTIMTFRLWLTSPDKLFVYVPEFENIGNPKIVNDKRIIQGFTACCAFSEIMITDYIWENYKLIKSSSLNIDRYTSIHAVETTYKNDGKKLEKEIRLSNKKIDKLIDKYDGNWKLE